MRPFGILLVLAAASWSVSRPFALQAQTVWITLGDSSQVTATAGARISVPLRANLSLGAGVSMASLHGTLRWPATRLRFDSLRTPVGWTAVTTSDSTAEGALGFSASSPL